MKEVQAIIFDLDNTLMDRDYTFRSFSTQFVQDLLGHLEPEAAEQVVEEMILRDADGYRDKDGFFEELSQVLPWQTHVTAADIRAYYDEKYAGHGAVMKHAETILNYCRDRGYILGLLTNGKKDIQHAKIDLLSLRHHFKDIVISAEVGISKPDPEIYQLALERLGVDAAHTLFIGDHPVNDIWGAGKAGMKGIWLRRNHIWDDHLDICPWKIINELDELKEIL
ncbi:HAD family hydrolase [Paenibacillus wynnii]|uniref:HAD family hydrolase n=1 Tax=Paenibacillus wynnii TaxID=268407 RepID=UPI00279049D4|nr:HAD family hydrolase [Paenibacillus wynnii]MDQ0193324.1 putative hydrolase of the HAD superfamily [Paenibacillus wynnii]